MLFSDCVREQKNIIIMIWCPRKKNEYSYLERSCTGYKYELKWELIVLRVLTGNINLKFFIGNAKANLLLEFFGSKVYNWDLTHVTSTVTSTVLSIVSVSCDQPVDLSGTADPTLPVWDVGCGKYFTRIYWAAGQWAVWRRRQGLFTHHTQTGQQTSIMILDRSDQSQGII